MAQQAGPSYVVRTVGSSCCNPSINKSKVEQILNEMKLQGWEYVDLYIDSNFKCGCCCPEKAAIMIFKQ